METSDINYHRRGKTGVLSLCGVIDIFEAQRLRETALRALRDEKAQTIRIDLGATRRLDIFALQILGALRQSLAAAARTFEMEPAPAPVMDYTARLGFPLFQDPEGGDPAAAAL